MGKAESKRSLSTVVGTLVWMVSLAVLGLAIAAMSCAHPVADDFARAAVTNWLDYMYRVMYLTWSGRWASIGIAAFVLPRIDLVNSYPLLIAILACVQLLGCAAYAGILADRRPLIAFSLPLFAMLWAGMPGLATGFYWFTGNVENQLPASCALVLVCGAMHRARGGAVGKLALLYDAILAALAFVIPGMHELSGLMLCIVLGAAASVAYASGRPLRTWIILLGAATAGFLVTFMAPGNVIRAENSDFPDRENVQVTVRLAFSQAIGTLPWWIADPKLLAATLCLVFWPGRRDLPWSRSRWRWLIPAASILLVAVGFAAPSWAIGNLMPERTLSTIYIVFVLGWFATMLVCFGPWANLPRLDRFRERIVLLAAIAFAASLLLTGNWPRVARALWAEAPVWHAAQAREDALLMAARAAREKDAVVPYVPPPPFFIMDEPVKPEAAAFPNMFVALYYGFDTIRMAEPEMETVAAWDFSRRPPGTGGWVLNRAALRIDDTGAVLGATADLDYLAIGSLLGFEVDGSERIEAEVSAWRVSPESGRVEVPLGLVVVFYAERLKPGVQSNWPFSVEGNANLLPVPGNPGTYRAPMEGRKGWRNIQDYLFISVKTGSISGPDKNRGVRFEIHLKSIRIVRPRTAPR